MDPEKGKKTIKRKYRGMTRKSMITKNRSKGIKLQVKYNLDGIFIGESTVHLTSYLGVLARTMVPIRYQTWHVVPKQLKHKLWDSIEEYREVQKERRKKHIYNHHLSGKGYAGLEEEMMVASGSTEMAIPVIEKIVRKCDLAVETKENIVVGGTIILECNYLVVVDASYDSSAPLPIPILGQTTTVGAAIGYQVLWPTHLVIIHTHISVEHLERDL
ncbi:unnamed protein product, partial [Vitis vinifera]